MKISTKGRYALRFMLDLAMHSTEGSVRIKDAAKRQEISVKYLEQIAAALSRTGYVSSVRGPNGGYRLAKQPQEYTLGMILRVTEGSLYPVACLEEGSDPCPRQQECVTLRLWNELDEAIKGVVDKYTLADLVEWQQEKIHDYVI